MKKRMIQLLSMILVLSMLLCLPAIAAETPNFTFSLSSESKSAASLAVGETLTVDFALQRTDSADPWTMYAWQTEISYDASAFQLVEGSVKCANGVSCSLHDGEGVKYVYFNTYSQSASGTPDYPASLTGCSFQLKALKTGSFTVAGNNNKVSTAAGAGVYPATAQDLTVTVTNDGKDKDKEKDEKAPDSVVWDGVSVDVGWYLSNPGASAYTIYSAAELAGVAALVNGLVNANCEVYTGSEKLSASQWNASAYVHSGSGTSGANNQSTDDYHFGTTNFAGVTITLAANLNMSAGNYMPIGGQYLMTDENTATKIDASFCGVLDGNCHSITISCDRHCSGNYGDGQSVGIVGRLGAHDNDAASLIPSGAAVCNLAVYGSVKGNRSVGGVVGKIGRNYGAVIENCANFASITGTDAKGTGGIVGAGWNGGTIKNCYNAGSVTNTQHAAVAGISGSNESAIINCYNRGKITGPSSASTAAIASENGGGSYTNCYWLDISASVGVYNKTLSTVMSKTAAELKSDEVLNALGSAFTEDGDNVNAGFPVLTWQSDGKAGKKTDNTGSVVIESKTTVSNGTANVTVTEKAVDSSIKAAEDANAGEVIIKADPQGKKTAGTNVTIPAGASVALTKSGLALRIEAADGSVATLDSKALKSASQAGSAELKIVIKTETSASAAKALESAGISAADAAGASIVSVEIYAGTKAITKFDGTLTLLLPAPAGRKVGDMVTVYQVSADGKVEKHAATVKLVNGVLVSEITTTHLSTFVSTAVVEMPFTDIKGHWASDAITYVYGNKLFSGISDTKFDPDGSMTRAMLVTVLYRMEGKPAVSGSNPFQDVAAGKWYTNAVIWAKANGIVDGYDATHFGTNDSVTREQIAAILMRYAVKKGYDVSKKNDLTTFADAKQISAYALQAVQWANAMNLITGRTATTIVPKGTATRAEVASILMRYQQNITK